MVCTQPRAVEGDARHAGGQEHLFLGRVLPLGGVGLDKVFPGQNEGPLGQGVGEGVGLPGHIGLRGVGEHVHARVRRHRTGHPRQEGGVQNGGVGQEGVVHQGVVHPGVRVGEDGEGGHLAAGARRGGHRVKEQPRPVGEMAHGLGAVHGGPAAEGQHRVGREVPQGPDPLGHQAEGGVRGDLAEHLRQSALEVCRHPGQQARLMGQKIVGNDEHPFPRQRLQGRERVVAEIDGRSQRKCFHGFRPPFLWVNSADSQIHPEMDLVCQPWQKI